MRLYSTLQRELVELPPPPGPVGIYACGPTVYQRIHVGNARPYVIFIWLRNWLRQRGYDVKLVSNITDVNDKIYEEAVRCGMRSADLAAETTAYYIDDTNRLALGRPDAEPKATETMGEIVTLIADLVQRDFAYVAEGDVYFRVGRFDGYGQLSGQRPDQVEEQEPNSLKEDPRDFALWKANKEGEDSWWDSPWGRGRPGWHIECSAMAARELGPAFEIHGGGIDLVFPHHENELAQSRAAGQEFAHIWMHNGLLRLTGEKMSKSVGNIETLAQVLDDWGRETLLLFFMTAHWRSPIDFSTETMAAAGEQAWTFRNAFLQPPARREARGWEALEEVLDDDFSTTEALAVMHEWRAAGQLELLARALGIFGLETLTQAARAPEELEDLARLRLAARASRDFDEADRLRDEIAAAGWEVRDVAGEPGYQLVPKV